MDLAIGAGFAIKALPGRPAIVFRSKNAVIFVHGCFWMGTIAASQLSSIQVKADEATDVRPFGPKEHKAILAAVAKTELQPAIKPA
jgi:hypothetical protein